jgi:hypothetical protein
MTGEEAVRLYLMYLDDPNKLVDQTEVKKLETELDNNKDPIDRLRAIAALERARNVDGQQYEADFVRYAKDWADQEGVPLVAFQQMNVPGDVLARAGFDGRTRRRRGATGVRRQASGRPRAKSVSSERNQEWALESTEPFTLTEVQQGIGGSPATVKKAIDELLSIGRLEKLGPSRDYRGRGRAPSRYARVGE